MKKEREPICARDLKTIFREPCKLNSKEKAHLKKLNETYRQFLIDKEENNKAPDQLAKDYQRFLDLHAEFVKITQSRMNDADKTQSSK